MPLLRGLAGTLIEEDIGESLERLLIHLPSGAAHACLWRDSAGQVSPVLVLEHAKAIADHVNEWAEGDPGSWFHLVIRQHRGRYALALFPNLTRSLARFQRARRLVGHPPGPQANEVMFVYRPLHFVSGPDHVYGKIRHRVPSRVILGLLDRSQIDPEHPEWINPQRIRQLGPFRVGGDATTERFVRDLIGRADEH